MPTTETTVDFRSDTVTQPTREMRALMAEAVVGDDVLDGDPSVQRLEAQAAEWLGKEGSIFVPSGTMANQIALGAHTRHGDEIVVQRFAHVTTFEAGSAGALHGLQSMTMGGLDGEMDVEEVRASLRPDFIHCPKSALICMEQTHNMAGGRVISMEAIQAMHALAQEFDIPMHLDGARLANAVVQSGIAAHDWCQRFRSVSLCLSKGLGAPVGSVIAGDANFLERAKVMRKRLGGWMRQAGHLAEAARWALDHAVDRLAEDHRLARTIAEQVGSLEGLTVDLQSVQTNMVMVELGQDWADAAGTSASLASQGVRVSAMGPRRLRIVTHRDVDPSAGERLFRALAGMAPGGG